MPGIVDVIVVGGGAIGCAVAWRLAQRGLEVTLVERGPLGGEASWAAAGILAPQAEADAPGPLFSLKCHSRALWPSFAVELREASGIDVGWVACGTLMVALDDAEAAALRARLEWQQAAGLRVEQRGRSLYLPDDHQVEPRLVGRALATALARTGVTVRQGEAQRLVHDRARVSGLIVDGEMVTGGHVVLAGGAWSSRLDGLPPMPRVQPLRGQLLELAAPPGLVAHVLFGDGGYLVPRADGRIVVGSSEEEVGFVKEVTPPVLARLRQRAARLVPSLAEAPLVGAWAGLRPSTKDRLPLLGNTPLDGLHVATGHHRNGILLLPVTAQIVTALVTGVAPTVELSAFSPSRA